jgi:O-6-methylguanine DNA methyltransferase
MTEQFRTEVLELVKRIPRGKVTTYGELARALNGSVRAARAVGQAVARNPRPIEIPCHRVVRSDGTIGEYGGGVAMKTRLLRAEGIEIQDGKVVGFAQKLFRFDFEALRFVTDRMLGKLSTWLRILGYDTVYAADLAIRDDAGHEYENKDEDSALISFAGREGRIVLTKDKRLAALAERRGVRSVLIKTDDVLEQLQELLRHDVPIRLEPTAVRCSICNGALRKVETDEADALKGRDYVPSDMLGEWEFWICEHCGRIYWEGSHWRDIRERLKRVNASTPNNRKS